MSNHQTLWPLNMEAMLFPKLLSCMCLIFLLNPLLTNADSPHSNVPKRTSLSYLNSLIGTQKGLKSKAVFELKKHLSYFGYLTSESVKNLAEQNADLFDDDLESAIRKYQVYFGLKQTGVLDIETVNKLKEPRCGVPDYFGPSKSINTNSSHYTFFPGSPKWWKTDLTYSFPPGIWNDAKQAILNATGQWATVTRFKFSYTPNYDQADIKISFQVWDHHDGAPFDGPSGILAHAFAPPDGRLHYDGSEKWIDGVVPGDFDLQTIGLHELGHVLGLGHTPDGGAVMFPTVGPATRKNLGQDDINGIRTLYNL